MKNVKDLTRDDIQYACRLVILGVSVYFGVVLHDAGSAIAGVSIYLLLKELK